ncbi:glycosyltransferase family 2 protein [Candidatus Gottesmanbacteria bacterium]|nr:glycosyltransferase family 2 protein [Candidatus Gottesmanbacteria bacterium]
MKSPRVSIVLVNWNGKAYIGACLRSLGKIVYPSCEVIVVDNASTDGSVSFIRRNFPHTHVIANKKNLGFAAGCDAALGSARGTFILLLNPDTTVEPGFLAYLVEAIERDKKIAVVQPKVLLAAKKRRIDSVGSFFLPTGLLYHFGREKDERRPQHNQPMKIFSAKGVCMLIRRSVIDTIGLFDPDYFAYFEETDFCMRAWLAGWSVWYEPRARIYHKGGFAFAKQRAPFIYFHSVKNMFCTYIKNLSIARLVFVFFWLIPFHLAAVAFFLLKRDVSVAGAILGGLWWNLTHMAQTYNKRQRIQTNRRISDEAYLPAVTRTVSPSYYYYQFFGNLRDYVDGFSQLVAFI